MLDETADAVSGVTEAMLLRGGTVVTMDEAFTVVPDGEVLIRGGRIEAIGRSLRRPPDVEVIDVGGGLILPGLIQGHVHLGQTFFRGLAEGRRLLSWLEERIWPLEAAHDDESAYWCALLGAAECLLGGTTTIQDIGIGPGTPGLLRALDHARIRAIAGKCLMDQGIGLPPGLAEDTDHTLSDAESLGCALAGHPRLRYGLNPRFILSCSDTLWRGTRLLAERHGWPIHTHALEQADETEAVRAIKGGRDEIAYFDDEGILDADIRIAHGVWLTADHVGQIGDRRFSVIHCPSSNLKLGSGVADVVALRAAGLPVGLGCDGTACCNHLDAFEEMRLAALLQKAKHQPGSFSGRDALALATREGARAIGLDAEVGSLECGKQADLVVLGAESPALWTHDAADPHDRVAFSAGRGDVRHVWVAGERLVADGELTRLSLAEIMRRATKQVGALVARSGVVL